MVSDARGVPVRVLAADADEVLERLRVVRNTVQRDPEAPTIEEIRAILDAPPEVEAADSETVASE